ncbi:MAG: L-serine ammonia-lyase, iron-sulfur-dependent, subunit alpha [Candidatus Gastranaerophilales bacterium]|nr:L-serine ammonia-lyase, iron-sulfur-dependent, subunit alpha [Candidatus Gastranaerophilales bacterium]
MLNPTRFEELKNICEEQEKSLLDLIIEIELVNTEISKEDFFNSLKSTLYIMKQAIKDGLKNEEKTQSKMAGSGAKQLNKKLDKRSNFNPLYNKIIVYAMSSAEQNARMGKIAACPTAGSCGIVPAVLTAYGEELGLNEEKQIEGLIIAGAVGKIIAQKTALAGACGGCQAECGAAAAMAAAAIVQMLGGSLSKILNAAALALKNVLGLTCDPVAGLVEVPCVKRNSFMAVHASVAAELAMSGIKSVIPVDEVVDALAQTGILMSPLLKETSQGGLATTKTGKKISEKLNKQWFE